MTCGAPLKPYSHSNGGFTLLEVLVSLTMMALITAVAFAGLSIGIDSWERGSRKIDELNSRIAVERLLHRQIAVADPRLFKGNDREMEFVSTYSLTNGPSDLIRVFYRIEEGRFLYSEMPVAGSTPERGDSALTHTLGAFSQVNFRYVGTGPGGEAQWVSSWTESMGLPVAVRAQIADDVSTISLVNR